MDTRESDGNPPGTFNVDIWNVDTGDVTAGDDDSWDVDNWDFDTTNAETGENEADQVATAVSKTKTARKKEERVKIMITLRGLGGARQDARAGAADRRAQYASMRALAKERQAAVLAWLKEKDVQSEYRRVSDVTAFGTFTMEATAAVAKLVRRAPQVESVMAASDVPMNLLGAR